MSLLAKFSRSQTPPVNDLPPPADNDRFKSSKPPTSGPRGATLPKSFTLPSYLPSAPPGVGSQPRRSSKTASKFGLHQLPLSSTRSRTAQSQVTPISIYPVPPSSTRASFTNRPSEAPPVEISLVPTPAPSGLRNIFTRSQTPQPQDPQQISSISNNIRKDIGTIETQSRSRKEREVQTASSSGANGLPPPPPGKDDVGPSILQKDPSQMVCFHITHVLSLRCRAECLWILITAWTCG
jgi:hypothetical protein